MFSKGAARCGTAGDVKFVFLIFCMYIIKHKHFSLCVISIAEYCNIMCAIVSAINSSSCSSGFLLQLYISSQNLCWKVLTSILRY